MTPRRILIASYYFPPDSAVGGLRAAKFVRSLPEFGWEPSVLTVEDRYRDQGFDHGRLKGLEGVQITRTSALPSLRRWYARPQIEGEERRPGVGPHGRFGAAPSRTETMVQRVKRYVISLLLMLPDDQKNWSIYGAFTAIRRIRTQKIDCVLTSGPPHSIHLIGLLARYLTDAKWIADFRDPWVEMLSEREPETRSSASDAIERWMERLVMTHADKVLTTTNRLKSSLIARYPAVAQAKFVCLPNSIDTHSIALVSGCAKYDALTITYAGTLYFDRTPEPLFEAVRELIEAKQISERDIRIKLVGNCQLIDGLDTREVVRRYGLESVVEVMDPVPYAEAIRIMRQSHLLLVIAPQRHDLVVGAKVFDYLGSGSKILALAAEGATRDLMEETQSGMCFSPSDIDGLRGYLGELMRDGTMPGSATSRRPSVNMTCDRSRAGSRRKWRHSDELRTVVHLDVLDRHRGGVLRVSGLSGARRDSGSPADGQDALDTPASSDVVTVVIPAYNEEQNIESKIRNVLRVRLSAGVSGRNRRVRRVDGPHRRDRRGVDADGVRLIVQPSRQGKTAGLNRALGVARGSLSYSPTLTPPTLPARSPGWRDTSPTRELDLSRGIRATRRAAAVRSPRPPTAIPRSNA